MVFIVARQPCLRSSGLISIQLERMSVLDEARRMLGIHTTGLLLVVPQLSLASLDDHTSVALSLTLCSSSESSSASMGRQASFPFQVNLPCSMKHQLNQGAYVLEHHRLNGTPVCRFDSQVVVAQVCKRTMGSDWCAASHLEYREIISTLDVLL